MNTLTLDSPIRYVRNCGPKKAAALAKLDVKTVRDLLEHYPSGYVFAPPLSSVESLQDGCTATVVGVVRATHVFSRNFEVTLDTGVRALWFGGMYLRESIFVGSRLMVSGVVTNGGFTNPAWRVLRIDETPDPGLLNTVVYPVTSGITSKDISRLVHTLPDEVWAAVPLWMRSIHMPDCGATADAARKQAKYAELFWLQLALAVRQERHDSEPPTVQCVGLLAPVASYFPFKFTDGQADAIHDICQDLLAPRAMNRLLQGDVGSGKTAVAAYAALVMAFNGGQTAILCPTEILARQHYDTIKGYFGRAGVECALLLGVGPPGHNSNDYVAADGPHIIVGTTALLSKNVLFRKLGLVVVDELHKFGVLQRAALRQHGNPHVLSMSATPIPRTIAMTVFGDLDISVIRSMPPGRKPVQTIWTNELSALIRRADGHSFSAHGIVEAHLSAGHQVYVVCPRIEALDGEMRAVEEVAEEYRQRFPDAVVGILHGQMPPSQRHSTASWWDTKQIDILVSTTVVEVGVDNPNATVMIVEGAERFGLAQLHQLRGRVGRSEHQSYCFLLSDTESVDARTRLQVMESTTDGFSIAEEDLKIRGPGSLLDTAQHGMPNLRIADLCEDYSVLVEARKEARNLVAKGPLPAGIAAELQRQYGDKLALGDVG